MSSSFLYFVLNLLEHILEIHFRRLVVNFRSPCISKYVSLLYLSLIFWQGIVLSFGTYNDFFSPTVTFSFANEKSNTTLILISLWVTSLLFGLRVFLETLKKYFLLWNFMRDVPSWEFSINLALSLRDSCVWMIHIIV